MHADYYYLPDDTRIDTSPNYSNQKIKALGKVTIDAFVPSQQTISPILNLEGTGIHCIDQKAQLMSDKKVQSPDWVTGLEGGAVTCEYVTIKLTRSTSLLILEGRLTATCDKWENSKSICSIDTGRASIGLGLLGAKTDSDLASPPGGDHPAMQPGRKLARVSSLGARRAAGDRRRCAL
jgi:hypothetical protein